jgi:hypothetical protein
VTFCLASPTAPWGELTDALFDCWRSDPIHGDKIADKCIAVGLVDKVEVFRNSIPSKKRP